MTAEASDGWTPEHDGVEATLHLEDQASQRAEAQLREVMAGVGDAFVSIDAHGEITGWSARSEEMFGWTNEEAVGRALDQMLIPERFRSAHLAGMAAFLATGEGPILGQRTELVALHKSGRELPVELTVWASDTDRRSGFKSFLRDLSDRHQAATAVAEINVFFDLTLDLLCIANLSGYFERLNPAWTELLGWSIEELTSRPFNDFVHPDDRDKTSATVGSLSRGALTYSFENRYRCKDGSYRWLMWNSRPLLETGRIYAIAHDVTAQKQAASKIADLATIVQSTNDAVVGWSPEGIITSWNPGAERMYGYPAGEMIGMSMAGAIASIVPEDRADETRRLIATLDLGGTVADFETVHIHRDGRVVDVSMTLSLRMDEGRMAGGSMIARDETRRKDAERERGAHSAMLQAVIANSQSLIYVKDLNGRYRLANEAFERAFGVSGDELLGQTDDFLDPELAPVWRINDLRAQRGSYHLDEWSDAPDGRHYYDSVKFPLLDAQSRLYGTCGISLDVTERRRAASALVEARDAAVAATAAKSAFLATMSHEIRTPMNAVIGLTGLLLDTELGAEQRDLLEIVRSSGDSLLSIINDVLDFSRVEAGQIDLEYLAFDLGACVEGALELLAAEAGAKGIELVCFVDEAPQRVVGDVTRVRQVLVNLLSNAIKFSERGGVMATVVSEHVSDSEVRLRFSVSDTGIGIPAESVADLFASFTQVDASTTRRYGGSGLGLAISKHLVEAMGGELTVVSELGVGSTFSFTLTVGVDDHLTAQTESPLARLAGRTALLVSPSEHVRRALRMRIQAWGMECVEVSSVEDSPPAPRDGTTFAVAVLDDASSVEPGVQLVAELRARLNLPELKVVLIGGISAQPARVAGAGIIRLTKPVKRSALRAALLSESDMGRAHPADDASPAEEGRVPLLPLRVLLAEDNIVNQKVGQLMLRKLGHRVDTVSNGHEAIAAALRQRYDVILMDLQMPEMDGLEATRVIRADVPAQCQPWIIAMTASVLVEDRNACRAAGMDAYLSKPVRQDLLATALAGVPSTDRA